MSRSASSSGWRAAAIGVSRRETNPFELASLSRMCRRVTTKVLSCSVSRESARRDGPACDGEVAGGSGWSSVADNTTVRMAFVAAPSSAGTLSVSSDSRSKVEASLPRRCAR